MAIEAVAQAAPTVSNFLGMFNITMISVFAHLVAGVVLIATLKYVGESITGFLSIKNGGYVIVGTPIKVNGFVGRITAIKWNTVYI